MAITLPVYKKEVAHILEICLMYMLDITAKKKAKQLNDEEKSTIQEVPKKQPHKPMKKTCIALERLVHKVKSCGTYYLMIYTSSVY